jgi:hypothetical protein
VRTAQLANRALQVEPTVSTQEPGTKRGSLQRDPITPSTQVAPARPLLTGLWTCSGRTTWGGEYDIHYFADHTFIRHSVTANQDLVLYGTFNVSDSVLEEQTKAGKFLRPPNSVPSVAHARMTQWSVAAKSRELAGSNYTTNEYRIVAQDGAKITLQPLRVVNWDGIAVEDISGRPRFSCNSNNAHSNALAELRNTVPTHMR